MWLWVMALLCLAPQEKCFQYWPEKGCWIYGSVRVAMEDFTVLVDYTIRKFYIQYVSKRWHLMILLSQKKTMVISKSDKHL